MTHPVDARFEVTGPYALGATMRTVSMGRYDPTWQVHDDRAVHALWTPEGAVTVAMKQQPTSVAVRAWGPGSDWVLPHMPAWLGLHDDPTGFDPQLPALVRLHRQRRGERLPRMPVLHSELWKAVLQQRVTWKNAARSFRALTRTFGEQAPGPFDLRLPPHPDALAAQPYEAFHPFGVERGRALLIRELARRAPEVDALLTTSLTHTKASLLAWRGIGPWTVEMTAGTALGDADAMPLGDVHLPHVVAYALHGIERSDDTAMVQMMEPFRPHRWRFVRLLHPAKITPPRRGPKREARWIPDA